jgi:hypothetical protein
LRIAFCNAFHPTLLSGGGSASPKTMGDQSPKAQGCSLDAAGMKSLALSADLFANVLRTTRSTLKQAFSSRNVSISHGHFEFR